MPQIIYDILTVVGTVFISGFFLYFAYKFSKTEKSC